MLTDSARLVRWTGPVFGLFSVILLPWTVYVAASLPSRQVSPDYDIAWAGFDVMLLVALAGTAYFALRRSRYLSTAATATAVLLVVDAWFDVLTTPSGQRLQSILLAVAVELRLASVCLWLSCHAQQLAERRIVLLLRRQRHTSRGRTGSHGHPCPVRWPASDVAYGNQLGNQSESGACGPAQRQVKDLDLLPTAQAPASGSGTVSDLHKCEDNRVEVLASEVPGGMF